VKLSDLPQRIKNSDKQWTEGAKPINLHIYALFHIKKVRMLTQDTGFTYKLFK